MKRITVTSLFFVFLFVFAGLLSAQSTSTPEGMWNTIDEKTGKANSTIEIYRKGDAYFGRIAKVSPGDEGEICTKCPGKQKGKPYLGLILVRDLKANGDKWDGGKILDPQRGSEYRLSVWYENDNPDVLFIRGKHWTGIYRTMQWQREK